MALRLIYYIVGGTFTIVMLWSVLNKMGVYLLLSCLCRMGVKVEEGVLQPIVKLSTPSQDNRQYLDIEQT